MYSWKTISPQCRQFYVKDATQANAILDSILADDSAKVFGIDIEWRPTFQKGQAENPVALLQLANDKKILLLHLSSMSEVPSSLLAFLKNPTIVKAGVGIRGDAHKIFKDLKVSPIRSCVDLGLLARSADNARWSGPYKNPIGLSRLIEAYHGVTLKKGSITMSNWESEPLSKAQIEYASNDAHAGYMLYTRLFPLLPSNYKSRFYSFDCYQGGMYEPAPLSECSDLLPASSWAAGDMNLAALTTWSCSNPHYDPGPKTEEQMEAEAKKVLRQEKTLMKKAARKEKRKAERKAERIRQKEIRKTNQLDEAVLSLPDLSVGAETQVETSWPSYTRPREEQRGALVENHCSK